MIGMALTIQGPVISQVQATRSGRSLKTWNKVIRNRMLYRELSPREGLKAPIHFDDDLVRYGSILLVN